MLPKLVVRVEPDANFIEALDRTIRLSQRSKACRRVNWLSSIARARARSRCRDSLLEEAVSSEPVSEAGFFGAWELRHDSEAVMDDNKAEMGYFRA